MLYTNTVIEYREGTRAAMLPVAAGLTVDADDFSERQNLLETERAIDSVLADSFPASDPPSWNPGISRPEPPAFTRRTAPWSDAIGTSAGEMRAGVIDVSRPNLGQRTFVDALVSLAGAAGIALLVPLAILVIGAAVALTIRGLLEAIGWLVGVVAR